MAEVEKKGEVEAKDAHMEKKDEVDQRHLSKADVGTQTPCISVTQANF